MAEQICDVEEKVIQSFKQANKEEGIRVFVAGGSRSGNDTAYAQEAYNLGKKIVKMEFKLDFGLSNSGIMGAVAKGVLDGWNKRQCKLDGSPIQGITTKKYFDLYPNDDELINKMDIVVAKTLEERKQKLLESDFVVFAPGGVGTLDELAYDCVAMQDGMLPMKPFIIYNINGFFHHLLEFLKYIAQEGFANPVPFIVVDNNEELEIAFRLLKKRYIKCADGQEAYANARQLVYELPYFIKQKLSYNLEVEDCIENMHKINTTGTYQERTVLRTEIETAYLEKEISRMYDRLAKTGRDTGNVSEKLTKLKKRRKELAG
ncbi:MAG: LOG family protein [Alphaproteobacteria bacterium]|nr:LOG family protein [Alphaproteobacteria bacterium]MDY4689801.1 LOG family protein [Alphaproteobacteria bacterium]